MDLTCRYQQSERIVGLESFVMLLCVHAHSLQPKLMTTLLSTSTQRRCCSLQNGWLLWVKGTRRCW